MNIMVLDTNLDAVFVLDSYKSLIWTDRYQESGDFELYTAMGNDISRIKQDYYLWNSKSEHVMIVEKILIESDTEEGDHITISGRSLESILDRRVIWGLKTLNGNLQDGIETLLNECIISPSKPERKIDNFIFEKSTDPAITELTVETQFTGDNLYDVIKNLCVERGIGFKVTLNENKQFVFKLYAGVDRSYDQTENTYVVFSPNFDNIISSNYMESKSSLKNVTLVGGEGEGTARRYTAVGNTSGLERREMFTDARDISSDSDDDMTAIFNFSQYPSQVFSDSKKAFVTDQNFSSCMVDVSVYAGRTIEISIPKYTNPDGVAPSYATIVVDSAKKYISTLKVWEKARDAPEADPENPFLGDGSLERYEIKLPTDAAYIYTSMFSQKAITDEVYYGETTDFECKSVQISNDEYITLLRQRGKEDLSENLEVVSFEGEAETSVMFKYGTDFFTGDIVQVADAYGHETKARVLELVTSEDENGFSVYPTFSTISETLPKGYFPLDFIEATGTQFINTGVQAPFGFKAIIDVQFTALDSGAQTLIGSQSSTAPYYRNFLQKISGGSAWNIGCYDAKSFGMVSANKKYRIKVSTVSGDIYCSIDGVDQGLLEEDFTSVSRSSRSLYLLASNRETTSEFCHARLYSCKIYDNRGNLVRDLVPCTNKNSVVGMFDLVGQIFYGNSGTGTFLAGRE